MIAEFGARHYPRHPQSPHTVHVIGQGAGFANRSRQGWHPAFGDGCEEVVPRPSGPRDHPARKGRETLLSARTNRKPRSDRAGGTPDTHTTLYDAACPFPFFSRPSPGFARARGFVVCGLLEAHRLSPWPPHRLAVAPALLPAGAKGLGAPARPILTSFSQTRKIWATGHHESLLPNGEKVPAGG
jgi:hypothetical protein